MGFLIFDGKSNCVTEQASRKLHLQQTIFLLAQYIQDFWLDIISVGKSFYVWTERLSSISRIIVFKGNAWFTFLSNKKLKIIKENENVLSFLAWKNTEEWNYICCAMVLWGKFYYWEWQEKMLQLLHSVLETSKTKIW